MSEIHHLSVSQARSLESCPRRWKAIHIDKTEQREPATIPMIVGNYFELPFFDPAGKDAFLKENEELIWPKGRYYQKDYGRFKAGDQKDLPAEFKKADLIIKTIADTQPDIIRWLKGDHQVKLEGEIGGVHILAYADIIRIEKGETWIVDLKCLKPLNDYWNELTRRYEKWWERYVMQVAVYRELYHQMTGEVARMAVLACSKEKPPNFQFPEINDEEKIAEEMDLFEKYCFLARKIANGTEKARRCGSCDYCRKTVKISGPTPIKVVT